MQMQNPVKVVLAQQWTNSEAEVELGPFNQGVVFEHRDLDFVMVDVATSKRIAEFEAEGWYVCGSKDKAYQKVFVHPYAERATLGTIKGLGEYRKFMNDVLGARTFSFDLPLPIERRLRSYLEDVDSYSTTPEDAYERDSSGEFTDESLSYALMGAVSRGLDISEEERKVHSRLDGIVVPRGVKPTGEPESEEDPW